MARDTLKSVDAAARELGGYVENRNRFIDKVQYPYLVCFEHLGMGETHVRNLDEAKALVEEARERIRHKLPVSMREPIKA